LGTSPFSSLFADELHLAGVVYDVAITVHQPAGWVDSPEVLVDPVAVFVCEHPRLVRASLVVVHPVEVADALVGVEVVPLEPERQRQLDVWGAIDADQVVLLEHHVERVFGTQIAGVLVDQEAPLIDDVAVFVFEVTSPQHVVPLDNLPAPVAIEVAHDVVLVEVSLVEGL